MSGIEGVECEDYDDGDAGVARFRPIEARVRKNLTAEFAEKKDAKFAEKT